jgi:hypothetical protein
MNPKNSALLIIFMSYSPCQKLRNTSDSLLTDYVINSLVTEPEGSIPLISKPAVGCDPAAIVL